MPYRQENCQTIVTQASSCVFCYNLDGTFTLTIVDSQIRLTSADLSELITDSNAIPPDCRPIINSDQTIFYPQQTLIVTADCSPLPTPTPLFPLPESTVTYPSFPSSLLTPPPPSPRSSLCPGDFLVPVALLASVISTRLHPRH